MRALSTSEAYGPALANAELIGAGAPVMAFGLRTEAMRERLGANPDRTNEPPILAHPSIRAWIAAPPAGRGCSASKELARAIA
jgi:hypothetical protein